MLAAGFGIERAVDQLDQAMGQKLGAFRAKTGLAQIEGLQDPAPCDIPFVLPSMMVSAIDFHHSGQHGRILFYPRS